MRLRIPMHPFAPRHREAHRPRRHRKTHACRRQSPIITTDNPLAPAACAAFLVILALILAAFSLPRRSAFAEQDTISVTELVENPYSSGGNGSFIRVDGPTSSVAYCAQGWLITPKAEQTLEFYGSLEIPELDYVMYHGYDGEIVTSLYGLDEQKSEAATELAVWLAIAEQRPDVLNFTSEHGNSFHGNKMYLERWQRAEDQEVKDAAHRLWEEGIAYRDGGGGGIEEGCAVLWINKTVYESDGTYSYQGLVTPDKAIEASFTKVSKDEDLTEGNPNYSSAGAAYDIYDAETNTVVTSIETDEKGTASCALEPNTSYYALETAAPSGYAISTDPVSFETGTGPVTVTLEDAPGTFSLVISKKDAATQGAPQPGTTLQGAEYSLVSSSTPGFELTGTTDETGSITFEGIPLGTVRVAETKAPTGYILDPTVHEYTVSAEEYTANPETVLIPENDFAEVPICFDIEISKSLDDGQDNESGRADDLAGIAFDIISNTTRETIGTIETDSDGRASSQGSWFGTGARPDGAHGAIPYDMNGYTVREDPATTPAGFEALDDWTISPEEMVDGSTLHFDVTNTVITTRLRIVKADAETGEVIPLSGFSFTVLDQSGQPVDQSAWYPEAAEGATFTTDESGSVVLPQLLRAGSYLIRETEAVAPYVLTTEDIPFEVPADASGSSTVIEVPNKPARGTIAVTKTCSSDGTPLAGAEYDVVAQSDIVSPTGTIQALAGQVVDHIQTDATGSAESDPLPLGDGSADYALVETSAPSGHVLDASPIAATITYADQHTELVHTEIKTTNDPTSVVVHKVEQGDGELPLSGAVFSVEPVDRGSEQTDPDHEPIADDMNALDEPGTEEAPGSESDETGAEHDGSQEGDAGTGSDDGGDRTEEAITAGPSSAEDGQGSGAEEVDPTEPENRFTTDENGTAQILHLAPGAYRIREVEAPAGYVHNDGSWEFTVDEQGLIDGQPTLELSVPNDYTKLEISKRSADDESLLAGASLVLLDDAGTAIESWVTESEPHRIDRLAPGEYTLIEEQAPQTHDATASIDFTIEATGEIQHVVMYDKPISITGIIDKRQESIGSSSGEFDYFIDAINTSSTWVDECTVTDELDCAAQGAAGLVGITTPVATGDYDGLVNVWYRTDDASRQPDTSGANATMQDGHGNPWLSDPSVVNAIGEDARSLDYTGWHLWQERVSLSAPTELSVDSLQLADGESITAVRFEFGCVSQNFATGTQDWTRDDLKSENDTWSASESEDRIGSPAVLHMRTRDSGNAGAEIANSAHLDLVRNGGGNGLQATDDDFVTQGSSAPAIIPLDQTGIALGAFALVAVGICSLGAWAALKIDDPARIHTPIRNR